MRAENKRVECTCQMVLVYHEDAGVGLEVDPGGRLDCLCAVRPVLLFGDIHSPPAHAG